MWYKFFFVILASLVLFGCPRERYSVPSGSVNIPLNTYSGVLVAKLSAFDEEKKLYYSTFRNVPLKYPTNKVFMVKDIRELRNIYNELKQYVPSAVREDNLMIRVGEEVVDYNFLKDKSAILITFNPGVYEVKLVSSKAIEKNEKVFVNIEYSILSSYSKNYPYLLVLFENPIKKDIEVEIVEKK
ncbi:MAG: hypothetical protein N2712_03840 [Brevinematales bacterium]|nr:hypothetical protein [Brevinematales bacterium]